MTNKLTDNQLYELIYEEIEKGNLDKALWTKSFADASGDEKKSQSNYIKYRFQALKKVEQQKSKNEVKHTIKQIKKDHDVTMWILVAICILLVLFLLYWGGGAPIERKLS
tara:strand:+ start:1278 stop:1607 length:330 start_codon:yes stop_codon:yes gene_type:complete